jgi:hypothetical protein
VTGWLLATAADASTGQFDWVGQLIQWGPAGVFLALLLTGVIEPKRAVTKAEAQTIKADAEAARWRSLFESEQTAHVKTREALAVANERATVAIENGKTTAMLLQRYGHPVEGQDRSPA